MINRLQPILAILPPFIAILLQWYIWDIIQPTFWFLFYPAVFFSAWIGGLRYGLFSTFTSIFLVLSFFYLNSTLTAFLANPKIYITLPIFLSMGILFSVLLGRLKNLNALLASQMRQKDISHLEEKAVLEKRFKSIIDKGSDVINLYNEKFDLIYLSPSFERLTGFTAEERKIGANLQLIHNEDIEKTRELMQEVLKSPGKPVPFQNRLLHKNGHYLWIEGYITNLLEDNTVNAIVSTYRDITARKKLEEAIYKLNAELEDRVQERTKQLETANKELEAFSYSVSHDLRAPLRAINGYSEIILEDYGHTFDLEGKRIFKVIRDEAKRMGQLIDDLLSFSRLGRTELQHSKIDMKAMAQKAFDDLSVLEDKSRIEFRLGDLPFATGDTSLIRQVWLNLLSNAIKFTSKKEKAKIEVQAEEFQKEIIYSVTDNGAGFDMRYSQKLFGVFQRLHNESEFEGTGVGLAIIKRAVTRNGGRVWAQGKVNEGAKIYFALPKGGTSG